MIEAADFDKRGSIIVQHPLTQPFTRSMICADIGGSFIDTGIVRPHGTIDHRLKVPTPTHDFDAFTSILVQACSDFDDMPLHIALAGLQDPSTGNCTAANIPCINGIDLASHLSEKLGRHVAIANDADCFALAEAHRGSGKGHRHVFGIILGTGVGGGFVCDGRHVVGAGGLTGEWGHGPFIPDIDGRSPCFACGCGQTGCIDTIGGARGLERLYTWSSGAQLDSRAILTAWRDDEPSARRTLDLYLDFMSSALAIAINITGATIVPAGGGLSNNRDLLAALDTRTRQKTLRKSETPLLVTSELGHDAGLIGAACL